MADSTRVPEQRDAHRQPSHRARRRWIPGLWATGAAAAVLLGLTVNGTISGFGAQIANSANTVSTGTLALQETGPDSTGTSTTCASTVNGGSCITINKYGSNGQTVTNLTPGQSISTTVTLKNTGTTNAGVFTLTPGLCTSTGTGTGNLCAQLQVTVTAASGVTLTPAVSALTPLAFKTAGASTISGGLAAGASDTFTVTVSLPSTSDNTFQGLTAVQPLTWNIQT